jgi:hypothetical protein
VREVWVGEGDDRALPALVLDGPAGPQRVVLGAGPLAPKLDRLAALLAGARAETAGADAIDVRFGGQVILRSDPPATAADGGTDPRGGADPPTAGAAG